MATIDPTDLRTKRGASSFYLSIFQPATLLAASVNNGSIARGARTIAYDGGSGTGFATIEAFQLLEVDTADGTKYVRLKSITGNQTSGTITVDENAIDWVDNQVIRVKHFYPLVPIPPSIRSQIFYKFYNVAYSNQNSLVNPVAIIGSHLVGTLSAGTVAFSLNSSSSYAVAQGASISSRVWSCVHNGGGTTGISFSNTTTANPTLTITQAGQYWLKCIVTDSNGKTQETFRAIFVYDSSTLPYKDFTVQSLSGDWQRGGWSFNFQATGDVTLADFPDLTLAVLWYDNTFNNVTGYVDLWGAATQQIVCAGYLRKDQDNDKLSVGDGDVNFEVTTPEAVMDNMSELGSISLNAVASPAKWYQYASWMTVGRAIHHVLKWHSSVLETCDVLGLTSNTLGVKNADFTEPSLLQMVNGLSYQRGIFAKLVSARTGRLYLVEDSQMLNDAGRAALDTVFSITTSDISDTIDLVRNPEERIATATLDGFDFNGSASTPIISIAPGYRESAVSYGMPEFRGISSLQIKGQVLDDQTDGNEKCGRVLAQANNNPFELRFTTPYNGIGAFDIVPSIGWYQWTISDSVLARDTGLNGKNLLCRNITHTINHEQGAVSTSLVFEIEALGADGIQGNYPTGLPAPVLRTPGWTNPPLSSAFIVAFSDIGDSQKGKVVAGTVGSISLGAVANFESVSAVDFVDIAGLSTTKAVVTYNATGTGAFCRTVNFSGTTVSSVGSRYGMPEEITRPCIKSLSSSSAIISYTVSTGAFVTAVKAVAITVSGDVITIGSAVTIEGSLGVGTHSSVTRLSATKALIVYDTGVGGTSLRGCIVDISGTTITAGTPANASATDGLIPCCASINSTTATIVFQDRSTGLLRASAIYSISGTTFSLGNDVQIYGASVLPLDVSPSWVVRFDNNRVFAAFIENSGGNKRIFGIVVSQVSGTLSSGTAATLVDVGGTDYGYAACTEMTTSKVVIAYQSGIGGTLATLCQSVNISNTTPSPNNDETTIDASTGSDLNLALLGSGALQTI